MYRLRQPFKNMNVFRFKIGIITFLSDLGMAINVENGVSFFRFPLCPIARCF